MRSLQITAEAMKVLYEKVKVGFRALAVQVDRILEQVATHLRVLEPHIKGALLKINFAFKDFENRLKGSSFDFFLFHRCSNIIFIGLLRLTITSKFLLINRFKNVWMLCKINVDAIKAHLH